MQFERRTEASAARRASSDPTERIRAFHVGVGQPTITHLIAERVSG